MIKIRNEDVCINRMASLDQRGKTFIYNGRFMRGIYKDYIDSFKEMFNCGLIKYLVDNQFVPDSIVSEYYTDEFPLIVESELINPVTYIFEWSYHMLCDAGMMILDLSEALSKYGYGLWDCHSYNVLYKNNKPIFCDIGSFYKKDELKSFKKGFPFSQFKCDYIMMAKMLRRNGVISRDILKIHDRLDLDDAELIYDGLGENKSKYKRYLRYGYNKLVNDCSLLEKGRMKYYRKVIESNQNKSVVKGRWSGYSQISFESIDNLNQNNSDFSRFNKIIDQIAELKAKKIYEWGGNQGILAVAACKRIGSIEKYFCCDIDDYCIDNLYCFIKKETKKNPYLKKIVPIVGSFWDPVFLKEKCGALRMKGDLVVALAIAHHLILGQGMNIDILFETISLYTTKYIIIEFMPLGLWGGEEIRPIPPQWYTLEWFLKHMEIIFDVINVEHVEENRILIVGEKKSNECCNHN